MSEIVNEELETIVVGTSGHIDHGKTTIIKHLTGYDTDTLPEEQKRGLTINLGFTSLMVDRGIKLSFIDVPGHEKFIQNAVAGFNGMDLILLVIAADDGLMPQTIEHLNIIELLGGKKGIVVITKCDLVDPEKLDKLVNSLKQESKFKILQEAPIVKVRSDDKNSYEALKSVLTQEAKQFLQKKPKLDPYFMMDVDRVFSKSGMGTVVTGTTKAGAIKSQDEVILYPGLKKLRVREIQHHGKQVEKLEGRSRCALNIAGVKASELKRGNFLTTNPFLYSSQIIDIYFRGTYNADKRLKPNTPVEILVGTKKLKGKLRFLGVDTPMGDEIAFGQLILSEPTYLTPKIRGILRFLSPRVTFGGFEVLTPFGKKVKRHNLAYLDNLAKLNNGLGTQIEGYLLSHPLPFVDIKELNSYFGDTSFDNVLEGLIKERLVVQSGESVAATHRLFSYKESILSVLAEFHDMTPLAKGLPVANLVQKVATKGADFSEAIFRIIAPEMEIKVEDGLVSLKERKVKLSKEQKKLKDDILNYYRKTPLSPPKVEEVLESCTRSRVEGQAIHNYLTKKGLLISIGDGYFVLKGAWAEIKRLLDLHFEKETTLTPSQARVLFGTSRKFTILFLEKCDREKVTKRVENFRYKF